MTFGSWKTKKNRKNRKLFPQRNYNKSTSLLKLKDQKQFKAQGAHP
jgi:hypothetical protein